MYTILYTIYIIYILYYTKYTKTSPTNRHLRGKWRIANLIYGLPTKIRGADGHSVLYHI
jgi:hypothetical protein